MISGNSGWSNGVIMGSGGARNVLNARVFYKIEQNGTNYKITLQSQLNTSYEFHWTGTHYILPKISWYTLDGVYHEKVVNKSNTDKDVLDKNFKVDIRLDTDGGKYVETGLSEEVSLEVNAVNTRSLDFYVTLDFTATQGSNCKRHGSGPCSTSTSWNSNHHDERPGYSDTGHDHYTYFEAYLTNVDVSSIPLVTKPIITGMWNANPYNNNSGISASTTSISVNWQVTSNGGDSNLNHYYRYKVNGGAWSDWKAWSSSNMGPSGLTPGTLYTVEVKSSNSASDSDSLSMNIRTRHSAPKANVSLASRDLETLTINWKSDKNLKSTEYKIDSGEWISLGQTGIEGKFTAQWFIPKTEHTIYFRGISADSFDAISTEENNVVNFVKGTTLDRSHINAETIITPGYDGKSIVFGMPINIPISREKELTKPCKIKIWANANGRNPEFIFENIVSTVSTFTFTPTQDQLDQLYKCYTNENQITLYFLIYTYSDRYKNYYWPDVNSDGSERSQSKALILTGIAKTAHIGVNNSPRRAQAWIGGLNREPHRAVDWVGVNNLPRRCI